MKRLSFMLVSVALAIGIVVPIASAAGPVTRPGSDYNGSIPKDCPIWEVQGTSLHVACTSSEERSDNARIRYRFLKKYGGVKAPATVSADVAVLSGPGDCYQVKWMNPVRTLRIKVKNTKPMCEIVVDFVHWRQP